MASVLPRPRQVTFAGWMIIAGSAAVVLTVFQQVAGLHSLDTRDSIERLLGEPPFDALGMGVDEILDLIRVLSMVAAACATATGILGWYVLQRSRSARAALSILALPLFVTGLGTGAVLSTAVAVGIGLLWLQPARDWFAGRWRPETEQASPPADPRRTRPPEQAPPAARQPQQPPQQPPPYAAWPPAGAAWPPPQQAPQQSLQPQSRPSPYPSQPGPWAPGPARRPGAVVGAVVVTWVCSVLLGGLFLTGAVWLIASPDALMEEMTRQYPELVRDGTLTVGLVRATVAVMAGVVSVWALAACVIAFFVLRGARWARVLLLVSTVAAGLGLLLGSIVNWTLVVPLFGAVAVLSLLVRRDVVAWFSATAARRRAG